MLYYRHHPNPPREAEVDPCNEAGLFLTGAERNLEVHRAEMDMIKVAEEDMIRVAEVEVDMIRVAEVDRIRVAEADTV